MRRGSQVKPCNETAYNIGSDAHVLGLTSSSEAFELRRKVGHGHLLYSIHQSWYSFRLQPHQSAVKAARRTGIVRC